MIVFLWQLVCRRARKFEYTTACLNDCADIQIMYIFAIVWSISSCMLYRLQAVVVGQGGKHALEFGVVLGMSPHNGISDLTRRKERE